MPNPHEELVVVGDGRVGCAFAQMAGPRTRLVRRGQAVTTEETENNAYPIIVATHCSDLDAVLAKTCKTRWKDLVFVQNGMLQPWLKQHYLQDNTQVLLFMSASPENPSEPKGHMHVRGGRDSCAWGRWADTICHIMQKGGLQCSVVSQDMFLEVMVEKLLWSSIFWLLSDALGGLSVGEIAQYHKCLVQELTGELLPLALSCSSLPSTISPTALHHQLAESEMVERLCAYSRGIFPAVPSKKMALSEFDWRNGWFLAQRATPCHLKWLKIAGIKRAIGSK
ncbi:hypothetical protein GOP47_0003297 [Adiantum capillus-veneris]|uniref:2-dehydropantoate 2-reductase n=1 Tax=Adiantum capillus-veneris TaxID=13818 RepID=A0A9D4VCI5_ADICA|nr:hypothetical protein GOP47_0003297 [Adiantum capillus-veneris]